MIPLKPARALAPALAVLALAGPAPAGKTAVGGIGGFPAFVPPAAFAAAPGAAAEPTGPADLTSAGAAAAALREAVAFCGRLAERAYLVDCLAERLGRIAAAMPAAGDLAPARAEIAQAAADLAALARTNRDRSRPRVTARVPGVVRTTRPLVPVDPVRAPDVAAAAADILGQAETILLRSPPRAEAAAAYREISAAVGTATVLLRSA
jgi:hypothetical protein